ncbi:MAG: hypothetical protein AB1Z23_03290 [Eubacteriales bacterium]
MRLIKSLFIAIIAVIMTAIAGSTFTHILQGGEDAGLLADSVAGLLDNIVHAEETTQVLPDESDILEEANHTFTTSLNIHTPSLVIDTHDLPTPNTTNNTSQSPSSEGLQEEYADVLYGIVPVSGEDIAYDKILGLSLEEIKNKMENEHLTIWQIAQQQGETTLLEDAYYAVYPARIIEMLNQEIISEDMADMLIAQAITDIEYHENVSIEEMIENMSNLEKN